MKKLAIPILAVMGNKDTGKTALIEELLKEFSRRGYKVGAVKHIPHPDFTIDTPNTDTWRYVNANAKVAAAVSPDEITIIRKIPKADASLDIVLKHINPDEVDLIIIEGFKEQSKDIAHIPKILIVKSKDEIIPPGLQINEIVIADSPQDNSKIPYFPPEEIKRIADMFESTLKKKENQGPS